jgi:hypothetical protein
MTRPVAASGTLTYDDVSDIVEALAHTLGKELPIPGLDFEDTAQEIRLECIRVLSYYDSTRIGPSPYKYLQTCTRNFLYNQRRGIWVPNNPPCVRCPLWDKVNKTCTIDEVGCDKIVQYRENMATKANLKQPASLEVDITDCDHEQQIDAVLLDESIREALPDDLVQYYERLVRGESVSSRIKKQIREIALGVINNA